MIDAILPDRFGHGVVSTTRNEITTSSDTNRIGAFTFGHNPDKNEPVGIPSDFALTVNDNGPFLNATDPNDARVELRDGPYRGGTSQAQARILIHELAHLLHVSDFLGDNGDDSAQRHNDRLVNRNCGRLLRGMR